MRLAFFHDFLTRMGGAEHVLATMAEAYPEAPIYTLFCDKRSLAARYPQMAERLITHPKAQRAYDRLSRLPGLGKHATKLLLGNYAAWVSQMDFSAYSTVVANSTAWGLGPITPVDTRLISYFPSIKGNSGHCAWAACAMLCSQNCSLGSACRAGFLEIGRISSSATPSW